MPPKKRTEPTSRQRLVIHDLVATTDTAAEILDRHKVSSGTYYNRWKKSTVFLEAYDRELRDFETELRHLSFASKRRRIEELEALYLKTPMTGKEQWPDGSLKR